MTTDLTPKQQKVLEYITQKVREDIPPTIREIAQALGFSSTGTVRDYLAALEKKGYLKRAAKNARAIGLLKGNAFQIPILGEIPAGKPSTAYECISGYIDTTELFLGRLRQDDVFALKVKGDSMIDAGIMDGDFAVLKKQAHAINGEIIAALVDENEATLKRLRRSQEGRCFLEPANKNYSPIYKEFNILGKLITVIRKY